MFHSFLDNCHLVERSRKEYACSVVSLFNLNFFGHYFSPAAACVPESYRVVRLASVTDSLVYFMLL